MAAIVFLPLIDPMAALCRRLVPDRPQTDDPGKPRNLDPNVLDTPAEALACAMRETLNLGDKVADMLRQTMDVFEKNDARAVKAIEAADDAVDRLYEAIKLYLIQTSRTELGEEDGKRYVEILTFVTNLEHAGDIIDKNLMELAAKKIKNRYAFSAEGTAELRAFHARVLDNLRLALNVFTTRDITLARRLVAEKTAMREAEAHAADSHYARLREGRPESIETSSIHMDVIRDLKRINGHFDDGGLSDPRGRRRTGRNAPQVDRSALGPQPAGIVGRTQRDLGGEPRAGQVDLETTAFQPRRIDRRAIACASGSPGRPRRRACGRSRPR